MAQNIRKASGSGYFVQTEIKISPRLPLEGNIDLTYRCNNNCRHCWIWRPSDAREKEDEFSFEDIRRIVDEARTMGCRRWSIAGGEPMLRQDFSEIFDYITRKSLSYRINTNGTLITPKIARLMRRRGCKKIALCGATAEVHDHITRNPGSFEATIRGLAYLKEVKAGFSIELIPMRDNYHQFDEMMKLARFLNPFYGVSASWLYLSAYGSPKQNAEIIRQRLDPKDVVAIDPPDTSFVDLFDEENKLGCRLNPSDDRLFARCIAIRRDFHIDPYGGLSFCCFIKNPELRYDLRRGNFREGWEEFIPSLADKVKGGEEYRQGCAVCSLRKECRWCTVFSYFEHRRHGAKVEYLCQLARQDRLFKEDWQRRHCRYYEIAGITLKVESDIPMTDQQFELKFKKFEVAGPGSDTISVRHHFILPDVNSQDLGRKIYRKPPWAIYHKGNSWIYLGISSHVDNSKLRWVGVFNNDYTRGKIYNGQQRKEDFLKGNLHSLIFVPTDEIILARVLADRQGCFLHSSAVILDGRGLLFVGHSETGKSTVVKMLRERAEILCDDRNIIRRWPDGFKVHGTWGHGEIPSVSSASAPLHAILFLHKSSDNRITLLENRTEIISRLLVCLIKPLVTADWWDKTLALVKNMVGEIPCYIMEFNMHGKVVCELENLVQKTYKTNQ